MCKGFAILANKKEVKYKEGNSHHSKIGKEDDYLKLEVVANATKKRGYSIQEDSNLDDICRKNYTNKGLYLKGKPHPDVMKTARKWCRENELIIFKHLAMGNFSEGKLEDQINKSTQIKGDQYNNSAEIKGNQNNYSAQIKGDQNNNSAQIKGDQINNSAQIKGDQYNRSAKIKGDQNNNSAEMKRMIIKNMKVSDKHTTKLIEEFSKNRYWKDYTLANFVKWLEARRKE